MKIPGIISVPTLLAGLTVFSAPQAQAQAPVASLAQLGLQNSGECEYCADETCSSEDQFYWSRTWFPGARDVLFLGEYGCINNWGATCSQVIGCEGDTVAETHNRIRLGIESGDWDGVRAVVAGSPALYATVENRNLLVYLAPNCNATPVVALSTLPPEIISGIAELAAGKWPTASSEGPDL